MKIPEFLESQPTARNPLASTDVGPRGWPAPCRVCRIDGTSPHNSRSGHQFRIPRISDQIPVSGIQEIQEFLEIQSYFQGILDFSIRARSFFIIFRYCKVPYTLPSCAEFGWAGLLLRRLAGAVPALMDFPRFLEIGGGFPGFLGNPE